MKLALKKYLIKSSRGLTEQIYTMK